jgi:hypothetical protein
MVCSALIVTFWLPCIDMAPWGLVLVLFFLATAGVRGEGGGRGQAGEVGVVQGMSGTPTSCELRVHLELGRNGKKMQSHFLNFF